MEHLLNYAKSLITTQHYEFAKAKTEPPFVSSHKYHALLIEQLREEVFEKSVPEKCLRGETLMPVKCYHGLSEFHGLLAGGKGALLLELDHRGESGKQVGDGLVGLVVIPEELINQISVGGG